MTTSKENNGSSGNERVTTVEKKAKKRFYNRDLIGILFSAQPKGKKQVNFAGYIGMHYVTINKALRARSKAIPAITSGLAGWFGLPDDAFYQDSKMTVSIVITGKSVTYTAR